MGTAYSTLLTDLRQRIREASANIWTDAQLAGYLSGAERWLAQTLAQIKGSGRFKVTGDSFTISADTETVAMSTANFDQTPVAILELFMQVNNDWYPIYEMQAGQEHILRSSLAATDSAITPPEFYVQDENLHFLPTSSTARTCKASYIWLPAVKGTGGTAETPTQYDDILILRAIYDALATQGQNDTSFEIKYGGRIAEMEDFEYGRATKGVSRKVQNVQTRRRFCGGRR